MNREPLYAGIRIALMFNATAFPQLETGSLAVILQWERFGALINPKR